MEVRRKNNLEIGTRDEKPFDYRVRAFFLTIKSATPFLFPAQPNPMDFDKQESRTKMIFISHRLSPPSFNMG